MAIVIGMSSAHSLETTVAQVGIHQSVRHFTSWHNMSNLTTILGSNTLFAFLGELVTTGVVLLAVSHVGPNLRDHMR